VQCLGTCDRAPAMMIGAELYRDLTPERLDQILAEYGREAASARLATTED
jgi:NADH:ubiquinone oxidoreductase subunit E